jgi:TetR/AcrR family transcriptional repressor of mexJK operon
MVYITHSGENLSKINQILHVAQKRFGLYGLEKTTMHEIASDLGISKASLYYYFPDKEHLFRAVVEMEQDVFFQLVDKALKENDDPIVGLNKFVKIRLDYFKTFFNLSRLRLEEFNIVKPLISDTFHQFCKREIEIVKLILVNGIEKGIFTISNPEEIATLFLELLRGLRGLVFQNKELMYVDQDDYDMLETKLELFTGIFIKGLIGSGSK